MLNGVCELCGQDEETICHLLWFCDHAKEVWTTSKFVLPFDISIRWNFLDMVENLQRREDIGLGLLERVITICWGIWKNKSVLRLGGKGIVGRTILRNAMLLVEEFHIANESKTRNQIEATPTVSWQPPSCGHYKVNTDGTVFTNRK